MYVDSSVKNADKLIEQHELKEVRELCEDLGYSEKEIKIILENYKKEHLTSGR